MWLKAKFVSCKFMVAISGMLVRIGLYTGHEVSFESYSAMFIVGRMLFRLIRLFLINLDVIRLVLLTFQRLKAGHVGKAG